MVNLRQRERDMSELMNHVDFRTALEEAIKGKSANKAPFSIAWASG
jgi:pyrroloquinoline-quinone synthase